MRSLAGLADRGERADVLVDLDGFAPHDLFHVMDARTRSMHHIVMHCESFLCYSEFMTISLRNLPKEVEKAILETSHREGISLNKATLRLLEAQLRKPAKNSDFEEFYGTWTSAEADAFDAALAEMRQVDPTDWESAG